MTDVLAGADPIHTASPTLRRFLEHARARPRATAVEDSSGELSYGALLSAARAQAGALAADGVRRGTRVAIERDYGTDYVVALLATWLLEAVAVPLDPRAPAERRRHQIRQARCGAAATLPNADGVVRAALAEPASSEPAPSTVGRPQEEAEPAAYILFTSGSTGLPKGVEIEHGGLLNMLDYFADAMRLGPGDRMLAHSSTVFDMSVPEMLVPLTSGGTIAVAPPRSARNPEFFARWLRDHRVDAGFATPSQLRLLLPFLAGERVFRHLVSAGEALPAVLAEELSGVVDTLWNGYGPTETTVCGLCAEVRPPYRDPLPIGLPIPGLRAHVLDGELQQVPDGSIGELCLSGVGVARGYYGSPELTARSFVTGPDGDRAYLTGDMVRVGPDGRFSFHGRVDDQVKIRGHRVELAEIESVAERTPGVVQAVAVLSDALRGRAELHLAVVAEAGAEAVETTLRAALRRDLPTAMRPGRLVFFDELPRNTSGKTSRKDVTRLVEARLGTT
ncbi:amino acid adenylation domain-containing protein [Streptomyces durbertensis]|uniref:Amino acid adenylation domain-containing protein n=1 Tax=Streptomyces durbertensis TaxID=2448886 RepID=A0ABR6EKB5_9ACTN|nr:amino acid adenylation domain-containing protein [Streptomyces durbertensis]MBB1245776.1 amino acid adenylation domain-containing protein [Streptomyces durbertensis]